MRVLQLLVLSAVLLFPSVSFGQSQEEPFFRLGANGDGSVFLPPDGEPNDDDELPPPAVPNSPFTLTYPSATVGLGEDIGTLMPQLGGDVSTTIPQEWMILGGDIPAGLEFDTQTGAISGHPEYAGVVSFEVKHVRQTIEPAPGGVYYGFEARTSVRINVAADYTITVTPSAASFVYGQSASVTPVTVEAATFPPQSGGQWGIARSTATNEQDFELDEPTITLNPEENAYQGKFQFYYEAADGSRVYSEPVDVGVIYPPYWDFHPAKTASYNAYYGDEDVDWAFTVEILRNTAFKIQPYPGDGAKESLQNYGGVWPSFLPPQGTLPAGVTISSTGAVKGTTTASVGSTYSFNVAAKSDDNRYGYSSLLVKVVDAFTDPDDDEEEPPTWCEENPEWWWEDPENTHGCATQDEYEDKWCEIHADDWAEHDPDNMFGCAPCYDEDDNEIACDNGPDPVDNGPYGDGDLGPFDWNLYPVCPLSTPYAYITWAWGQENANPPILHWFKGMCQCQMWEDSSHVYYRPRTEAELNRIRRGDSSSAHGICRNSPYHLSTGYFQNFPQYDEDNNIIPQ